MINRTKASSRMGWVRYGIAIAVASFAGSNAFAEFTVDRSVMSDAYWQVWNGDVQAKIDADIERCRKADATVAIAAPDGVEVTVEQKTHAFRMAIFGSQEEGSPAIVICHIDIRSCCQKKTYFVCIAITRCFKE